MRRQRPGSQTSLHYHGCIEKRGKLPFLSPRKCPCLYGLGPAWWLFVLDWSWAKQQLDAVTFKIRRGKQP